MVSMLVSKTKGESSSLSTPAWILRYGVMASTLDFGSNSPGSSPGTSTNTDLVKGITSYTLMFVDRSSKCQMNVV